MKEAGHYRQRAEELRDLADSFRDRRCAESLYICADQCEQLAAMLDNTHGHLRTIAGSMPRIWSRSSPWRGAAEWRAAVGHCSRSPTQVAAAGTAPCRPYPCENQYQSSTKPRVMGRLPGSGPSPCRRQGALALQLHFFFEVSAACLGLVSASPERPGDDVGGLDALLRELDRDTTDFLNRPSDQERRLLGGHGGVFLSGAASA